jgi:hypothetical protein
MLQVGSQSQRTENRVLITVVNMRTMPKAFCRATSRLLLPRLSGKGRNGGYYQHPASADSALHLGAVPVKVRAAPDPSRVLVGFSAYAAPLEGSATGNLHICSEIFCKMLSLRLPVTCLLITIFLQSSSVPACIYHLFAFSNLQP